MSKAKEITNNIVEDGYSQVVLLRILLISLISLALIYVYLTGSIIFNVIARRSLEITANNLSNNISQLELTYLNNTLEINRDYATTKGFVDVKHNIFATRSISRVAIR